MCYFSVTIVGCDAGVDWVEPNLKGRGKGVIDPSLRSGLIQHFPHLHQPSIISSLALPLSHLPSSLIHHVGRELRTPNPVNDTRANMASSTASTHSKPIIVRSRTNPPSTTFPKLPPTATVNPKAVHHKDKDKGSSLIKCINSHLLHLVKHLLKSLHHSLHSVRGD